MRPWFLLVVVACGRDATSKPKQGPHKHAPVDPRLYAAIVVPRDTKSIGGPVLIEIEPPNLDATAFAAKLRAENQHGVVQEPIGKDDKGLVVVLKSQPDQKYPYSFRTWYRTVNGPGGPIGVSCFIDDVKEKPEIVELTKLTCDNIQLVDDGIYVPFSLAAAKSLYTEHNKINLSIHDADGNDPPDIDKVLDVPKDKRVIDRQTLADGWAVLFWADYLTNHEYQGKVRRTLNGHDVWCDADSNVEAKAREQYEWCLALEAP